MHVNEMEPEMEQPEGSHSSQISYRGGVDGPKPVLKGTNLRVQTIVTAAHAWNMTPAEVAADYDLEVAQVLAALRYYTEHRAEIDAAIETEKALEHVATAPENRYDHIK